MLDVEVKRRRGELLKKFRLDLDRIPIRSDFERKPGPENPANKVPQPTAAATEEHIVPLPPIPTAVEGVSTMWQQLTSETIKELVLIF